MAETTHYRYSPASRLHELKTALASTGGLTVYEIAERFGVSVRTAIRYLRALQSAGEPLEEMLDGKRKVWRLHPASRREAIALTTTQMVSLFLSRRVFDFLAGTGFKVLRATLIDGESNRLFDGQRSENEVVVEQG